MTLGNDQGPVRGAVGPEGATNVTVDLETCAQPLGVIALVENNDPSFLANLTQYGLTNPNSVLRLLMQQSNCFQVVDRGQALTVIQNERALLAAGELEANADMGGGQIVAADLALTPNVVFSGNTGGGGAALLGAFLPGFAGLAAGAVASSLRFSSAQAARVANPVAAGFARGYGRANAIEPRKRTCSADPLSR